MRRSLPLLLLCLGCAGIPNATPMAHRCLLPPLKPNTFIVIANFDPMLDLPGTGCMMQSDGSWKWYHLDPNPMIIGGEWNQCLGHFVTEEFVP